MYECEYYSYFLSNGPLINSQQHLPLPYQRLNPGRKASKHSNIPKYNTEPCDTLKNHTLHNLTQIFLLISCCVPYQMTGIFLSGDQNAFFQRHWKNHCLNSIQHTWVYKRMEVYLNIKYVHVIHICVLIYGPILLCHIPFINKLFITITWTSFVFPTGETCRLDSDWMQSKSHRGTEHLCERRLPKSRHV